MFIKIYIQFIIILFHDNIFTKGFSLFQEKKHVINYEPTGATLNDLKLDASLYGTFSPKEMRSTINSIYNARQKVEDVFRHNPVAMLAEEMSETSRDYACLKQPISNFIYENRTDFARGLNFAPNNFNCGKQFDVTKLLSLVKKYNKLTPYTVGVNPYEIEANLSKNLAETSEKNGQTGSTVLSKDTYFRTQNRTTTVSYKQLAWWVGNQPNKDLPQEARGKLLVKPVTQRSTSIMSPSVHETRGGKKILSDKNSKLISSGRRKMVANDDIGSTQSNRMMPTTKGELLQKTELTEKPLMALPNDEQVEETSKQSLVAVKLQPPLQKSQMINENMSPLHNNFLPNFAKTNINQGTLSKNKNEINKYAPPIKEILIPRTGLIKNHH